MHKKKIKKIIVEKFKYDNDDLVVKRYSLGDEYQGLNVCPKFLLKLLIHVRTLSMSDEEIGAVVDRMVWYNEENEGVYIDDGYWEDLMAAASAVTTSAAEEAETPSA